LRDLVPPPVSVIGSTTAFLDTDSPPPGALWFYDVEEPASGTCGESACANGIDDDGDTLSDCADADCARSCPETACGNGLDDDGDTLTDCADPDCRTSCPETNCSDGVDNDG